jgi:hypothetical protein
MHFVFISYIAWFLQFHNWLYYKGQVKQILQNKMTFTTKKATIINIKELQTQCKPKMRHYNGICITKYFLKVVQTAL